MSYDIWLEADLGGPESIEIGDTFNYTSNCSGMWRKAMPETDGLAGFDEQRAVDVIPVLQSGIRKMQRDPEGYIKMEPDNGWGDFDGQLDWLKRLLEHFQTAPAAQVRVSR